MKERFFENCIQISVADMISARDKRKYYQDMLLKISPQSIISYTLNIAGSIKVFPLAEKTFLEGMQLISSALTRNGYKAELRYRFFEPTGYEALFTVDAPPEEVKRIAVSVEDTRFIGRLFDFDVLRSTGQKVTRQEIGLNERRCLICGETGAGCSRSRRHSVSDLLKETTRRMNSYFNQQYATRISQVMMRALLYELSTTPKPGLVDRANSGSHKDMDFLTFIDSTSALLPYFYECTLCGLLHNNEDSMDSLFHALRQLGKQAEQNMLNTTSSNCVDVMAILSSHFDIFISYVQGILLFTSALQS